MTNTIFDLVETDLPAGQEGYMELAKRAPQPKENSFFNDLKDYGKTALKGTVEGLGRLGRMMGPTGDFSSRGTENALEQQTQSLDELLPTEEGVVQKTLRRGLREAPSMLSFPGMGTASTGVRTGIAAILGQGAEEAGLPEWAQAAAELTAFIGPDVTKKLLSTGKNKEIIDAARKIGLSDEAITPLLQSEFKQKWLAKLSPRRGKTQSALEKTKSELGKASEKLEERGSELGRLSDEGTIKLFDSLENTFEKMPASVRNKIKQDYSDFYNKNVTGESLINFWRDINHELGQNTKQLSLLKPVMKEALSEISPQLSKDFEFVNKLFSKYHKINARLQPNLMTDLIGASEAIGALVSATTGNYPYLIKIAGEKSARKLAQQMLINPRFQQISNKIADAIKKNDLPIAQKLVKLLSHETNKYSPEVSKKLDQISEEELLELFKTQQ